MAQLTKNQILELSEPVERAYQKAVDQLLINIAKHLQKPTSISTADWQVKKLAEMGQLNRENAAIIRKALANMPQEVKDAMTAASRLALADIEKAVLDAGKTPIPIDHITDLISAQSKQAIEQLNQVNTVMLDSGQKAFLKVINNTVMWEKAGITNRDAALDVLNQAAQSVATGSETRVEALKRAIKQMANEGLTGFVDRAGRHWSPEAYVNMDIRTTVHNTAIQSIKTRMDDYGTQVFQCSSHAASRPEHYPFQGKYYSWDNTQGRIELGNGKTVSYAPVSDTGYGTAAGLFGINCTHTPIPVIPGVSIPHGKDNIEAEKANDKAYAESQQQRALERRIREAKRKDVMLTKSGLGGDKAAVSRAQASMREFVNSTGRKRRYDREQI